MLCYIDDVKLCVQPLSRGVYIYVSITEHTYAGTCVYIRRKKRTLKKKENLEQNIYIYIARCNIYVIDVKGSDENYARRGHAYGLATDVPNLFQMRFIFILLFFFLSSKSYCLFSYLYCFYII